MYPISPIESATNRLSEPVRLNWLAIADMAKPMSATSKNTKK